MQTFTGILCRSDSRPVAEDSACLACLTFGLKVMGLGFRASVCMYVCMYVFYISIYIYMMSKKKKYIYIYTIFVFCAGLLPPHLPPPPPPRYPPACQVVWPCRLPSIGVGPAWSCWHCPLLSPLCGVGADALPVGSAPPAACHAVG